jgi:hypothetical protein
VALYREGFRSMACEMVSHMFKNSNGFFAPPAKPDWKASHYIGKPLIPGWDSPSWSGLRRKWFRAFARPMAALITIYAKFIGFTTRSCCFLFVLPSFYLYSIDLF